MQKAERKEYDLLSKAVFGSSSRWQKLIGKGYDEVVSEEIEETIPAEKEGDEPTKQKIQRPILKNGARQLVRKYHTVESVLEFMVEQNKKINEFKEKMEKAKEEYFAKVKAEEEAAKAKAEQDKVINDLQTKVAGSAAQ